MPNYRKTKYACYFTYLAMSSAFSLPPLLFTTFRQMYGISYTLLGALVATNFCTQLAVDLLFSFFGKYVDARKVLRITPLITSLGLTLYALVPMFAPGYAYAGLLAGTFVFSLAAGLAEVLVSPTVAALPSDTPEKDMAALHSLYGYGVVMVVALSTLFLQFFGEENWMYLTLFWAILPIISSLVLFTSPLPDFAASQAPDSRRASRRNTGMVLCVLCIFFGSCAENAMTNWISGYLETALQIPKAMGDLLGLMLFAILLALTRTCYAKYGRSIYPVLLVSMTGAVLCYLLASLSPLPLLSMAACVLTGICTSMLWPGTLIYMEEKIPHAGVAAYALMAAGGDLGASIAPEMVGILTDTVAASPWGLSAGQALGLLPEQLGMKVGILAAAVFPLLGIGVLLYMKRYFRKN